MRRTHMSDPKTRHEIGKIVLPKRKKSLRSLPPKVRALLDPSEEEYEPLREEEENDDDNVEQDLHDDNTELISFDYGDHNYAAAPVIDLRDHNYCGF